MASGAYTTGVIIDRMKCVAIALALRTERHEGPVVIEGGLLAFTRATP